MMIKMLPGKSKPPNPPAVDLSHLTEEEREVIQKVIDRQKALEDETFKIERNLAKELEVYEIKNESSGKSLQPARLSSKNLCTICQRTKFTETVSPKICKYCKQQTCTKCGEQIAIPVGNKQGSQRHLSFFSSVVQDLKALTSGVEATWTCLICRKKQELLAKTGTWFHGKELISKDPVKQIELGIKNSPPVTPTKQRGLKHALAAKGITSGHYSSTGKKGLVRSNSDELADSKSCESNGRNSRIVASSIQVRPSLRRTKSLDQSPLTEGNSRDRKLLGKRQGSPNTLPKKKSVTFGDNKQFDDKEVEERKPLPSRQGLDCTKGDESVQTVIVASEPAKQEPEMTADVSPHLTSSYVRWSPPDEDQKIIGDIFLSVDPSEAKQHADHCTLFGFRVSGGQRKPNGKLGTVITEVFPDSFAERVAQLHAGDEILEWNEQSLVDCNADEVQDIVLSDDSLDLHLIVSRECATQKSQMYETAPDNGIFSPSDGMRGGGSPRSLHDPTPDMEVSQLEDVCGSSHRMPSGILKQTTGRPQDQFPPREGLADEEGTVPNAYQTQLQQMPASHHIAGRLQVKLWYDKESGNLYVTVLSADGLLPRENGQLRNPYVKLYFLPDRSLQSKRRTKTALRTVSPRWNQTFMYMCKYQKLQGRALEFTVWDYDRFEVNEFIGEVVLDMSEVLVDNMPHSYPLTVHNYEIAPLPAPTPLTSPRGSFREKEKPTVVVRSPAEREPDSDSGLGSVENMDSALPRQSTGDDLRDLNEGYDPAYQQDNPVQFRTQRDHMIQDELLDHGSRAGFHTDNTGVDPHVPPQFADGNIYMSSTSDRNNPIYNVNRGKTGGLQYDPNQVPGVGFGNALPRQGSLDGFGENKPTLLQRASQFIQQQLQPLNTVFDIKSQQKMDNTTVTTVTTSSTVTDGISNTENTAETDGSSSRGVSPYRQMPLGSLGTSPQEGQYLLKTVSPAQRYRQYQQGMYQQQLSQTYGPEVSSSQRRKYSHSTEDQYRTYVDDRGFLQLPGQKSSQGHGGGLVSRPGAGRRASVGTIMPTNQGGSTRDYSYSGSNRPSPAVDRKHHHRTLPNTSSRQPMSDSERDEAIRRQINDLKLGRGHSSSRHDRQDRGMYDNRLHDPSQMMHPALANRRTSSTSKLGKLQGRSNSSDNIKLGNSVSHGGYATYGHSSLRSQGRSRSSSALPATEYQMHPAFYGLAAPDSHLAYESMSDSGSMRPRRRRDSCGRASPTSSVTSELSTRSGSSSSIASSLTLTSIDSSPWISSNLRMAGDPQLADFVEGLGPGQMVGRQTLGMVWPGDSKRMNNSRLSSHQSTFFPGSPHIGDIQISLFDRRGTLEVEIIRARGLVPKPGSKTLPAPYVKVYVMDGKRCVLKKKTKTARRTLDPLYQQQLEFPCNYNGKTLQVMVWGDYGRIDRKVFMGVCQILLDDLDLSQLVIGWYKLFSTATLSHTSLSGGSSVRGSDREEEY